MFDFLKRKEFAEITRLNNELLAEKNRVKELQNTQQENSNKIESLIIELGSLKPYAEIRDIEREKKRVQEELSKEKDYYNGHFRAIRYTLFTSLGIFFFEELIFRAFRTGNV